MNRQLLKKLQTICYSSYSKENREILLDALVKMHALDEASIEQGHIVEKLDKFIAKFCSKYAIRSVNISKKFSKGNVTNEAAISVGTSTHEFRVIQCKSEEALYVIVSVMLFLGVKFGEYKKLHD